MKNIVVLVSGGGTNLQALIDAEKSGIIKGGRITCVISSKEGVYALERAAQNGIKSRVIPRKEYPDIASYTKAVTDALIEGENTLVLCAQDDTRSPHQPSGKQYQCHYGRNKARPHGKLSL